MTEETGLWVWEELDVERWRTIGALVGGTPLGEATIVAMVFRRRDLAAATRHLAVTHGETNQVPVRLAYYTHASTIEEITPRRGSGDERPQDAPSG